MTSELKTKQQELRELRRQQVTVDKKTADVAAELDSLRPQINAAEKHLKDAEAHAFREIAAPGEVANARSALDSLLQRGRELAGQQALAKGVIHTLDSERMVKDHEVKRARDEFCNKAFDAIATEIASDRKLRARVLEAYSLTAFQARGSRVIWSGILEALITEPDDDEISLSIAATVKKYDLPSEVDHGAA